MTWIKIEPAEIRALAQAFLDVTYKIDASLGRVAVAADSPGLGAHRGLAQEANRTGGGPIALSWLHSGQGLVEAMQKANELLASEQTGPATQLGSSAPTGAATGATVAAAGALPPWKVGDVIGEGNDMQKVTKVDYSSDGTPVYTMVEWAPTLDTRQLSTTPSANSTIRVGDDAGNGYHYTKVWYNPDGSFALAETNQPAPGTTIQSLMHQGPVGRAVAGMMFDTNAAMNHTWLEPTRNEVARKIGRPLSVTEYHDRGYTGLT